MKKVARIESARENELNALVGEFGVQGMWIANEGLDPEQFRGHEGFVRDADAFEQIGLPGENLHEGVGVGLEAASTEEGQAGEAKCAARIAELAEHTTVALGTDNAMLNSASMFREMEFTAKLTDLSAHEILRMATINGAALLDFDLAVEVGNTARLCVLDGDSHNLASVRDPVRAVVRRAGVSDVEQVVLPSTDSDNS